MTFDEKYAGMAPVRLRAKLDALSHDIDLLTKFWNDYQRGEVYYSVLVPVEDPEFWAALPLAPADSVLLTDWEKIPEFIHNFCTNLCAEKIYVKDLLNRQAQP